MYNVVAFCIYIVKDKRALTKRTGSYANTYNFKRNEKYFSLTSKITHRFHYHIFLRISFYFGINKIDKIIILQIRLICHLLFKTNIHISSEKKYEKTHNHTSIILNLRTCCT